MTVIESTTIGCVKVELIQNSEEFWACEYDSPKLGVTLAIGDEAKARTEYNKVKVMSPCQLRSYLDNWILLRLRKD